MLKTKFKKFEPNMRACVKNLGFRIDNELKMDKQINSVVRSFFFFIYVKLQKLNHS